MFTLLILALGSFCTHEAQPVQHSNTTVPSSFGAVGRSQDLLGSEMGISTQLVSRPEHEALDNLLEDAVLAL